ncbi:Hypothetical protein D9617_32g091610 [Elsinoe fawcettii]|nr:Hypothetical protein D9617_32g091610 [Elsinoe fawcettii]
MAGNPSDLSTRDGPILNFTHFMRPVAKPQSLVVTTLQPFQTPMRLAKRCHPQTSEIRASKRQSVQKIQKQRQPAHPCLDSLKDVTETYLQTVSETFPEQLDEVFASLVERLDDIRYKTADGDHVSSNEYCSMLDEKLSTIMTSLDTIPVKVVTDPANGMGSTQTLSDVMKDFENAVNRGRSRLEELTTEYAQVSRDIDQAYVELLTGIGEDQEDHADLGTASLRSTHRRDMVKFREEITAMAITSQNAVKDQGIHEDEKEKELQHRLESAFNDAA